MENRPKMDRAERAKQFMPFAALKGYEEALREREQRAEKDLQEQKRIYKSRKGYLKIVEERDRIILG